MLLNFQSTVPTWLSARLLNSLGEELEVPFWATEVADMPWEGHADVEHDRTKNDGFTWIYWIVGMRLVIELNIEVCAHNCWHHVI